LLLLLLFLSARSSKDAFAFHFAIVFELVGVIQDHLNFNVRQQQPAMSSMPGSMFLEIVKMYPYHSLS